MEMLRRLILSSLSNRLLQSNRISLRDYSDKVAKKVGKIWGIGEDGEMANMWKATPQKGLWFMAGSLARRRIYSKYLALQIKTEEELR